MKAKTLGRLINEPAVPYETSEDRTETPALNVLLKWTFRRNDAVNYEELNGLAHHAGPARVPRWRWYPLDPDPRHF